MPKLRVLSGQDVCSILRKHGFEKARQAGSHIIMQKRLPKRTTTVPVPNHRELSKGTLRSIIEQSEIPKTAFMT